MPALLVLKLPCLAVAEMHSLCNDTVQTCVVIVMTKSHRLRHVPDIPTPRVTLDGMRVLTHAKNATPAYFHCSSLNALDPGSGR